MMLYACLGCGHIVFPARQICHRCGTAAWRDAACDLGVIEQLTVVRHGVGAAGTVNLASVRTALGVTVLARLNHAAAPGATVRLVEADDGAVLGHIVNGRSEGVSTP